MTVRVLLAEWRADAERLRRYGAEGEARAVEACAAALETALRAQAEELMSLTEAAHESGYAPDTLGRMIRDGRLANHGTRRRPRVRRADLPRRAFAAHDQGARRAAADVVARLSRGPHGEAA